MKSISGLLALLLGAVAARADLVLEQQSSDASRARTSVLKLHGDKMRLDQPDNGMTVIINLKTRDSFTLLTTNRTFLSKFGSEVRWEMQEEKKLSHGTNEMDKPPAPAVATGKFERVNGYDTEIYNWSGAHGLTVTLWVAKTFPNYDAIKPELARLDWFNDTGPHPNAQPELSRLPGMVIKSESVIKERKLTTTLVSAKLETVDASLFELPADYVPWKKPDKSPVQAMPNSADNQPK